MEEASNSIEATGAAKEINGGSEDVAGIEAPEVITESEEVEEEPADARNEAENGPSGDLTDATPNGDLTETTPNGDITDNNDAFASDDDDAEEADVSFRVWRLSIVTCALSVGPSLLILLGCMYYFLYPLFCHPEADLAFLDVMIVVVLGVVGAAGVILGSAVGVSMERRSLSICREFISAVQVKTGCIDSSSTDSLVTINYWPKPRPGSESLIRAGAVFEIVLSIIVSIAGMIVYCIGYDVQFLICGCMLLWFVYYPSIFPAVACVVTSLFSAALAVALERVQFASIVSLTYYSDETWMLGPEAVRCACIYAIPYLAIAMAIHVGRAMTKINTRSKDYAVYRALSSRDTGVAPLSSIVPGAGLVLCGILVNFLTILWSAMLPDGFPVFGLSWTNVHLGYLRLTLAGLCLSSGLLSLTHSYSSSLQLTTRLLASMCAMAAMATSAMATLVAVAAFHGQVVKLIDGWNHHDHVIQTYLVLVLLVLVLFVSAVVAILAISVVVVNAIAIRRGLRSISNERSANLAMVDVPLDVELITDQGSVAESSAKSFV